MLRKISFLGVCLALALALPACQPPATSDKELQDIKAELAAVKEKLASLEAGQKEILARLQQLQAARGVPQVPAPAPTMPQVQPAAPAVEAPQPLSVEQLIKDKDRYLGSRVTVKGMPGPVLVHKKSLLLKSSQGMVEVLYGGLPDQRLVTRLSSTPLDQPLTVTGVVSPPSAKGGAKLQITAEAVEF